MRRKILNALLHGPKSVKEIVEFLNFTESPYLEDAARDTLWGMVETGTVVMNAEGKYALPTRVHKGMTEDEAKQEAARRWGNLGIASVVIGGGGVIHVVGKYDASRSVEDEIYRGRSWEAAFELADMKVNVR